ncbi:MAG: hypothetical protein AB9891_13845 [Anaerolineaceae bacterium]
MPLVNKRFLKILALAIFLIALAMLFYSLPGNPLVSETIPVAPTLLVPPAGALP